MLALLPAVALGAFFNLSEGEILKFNEEVAYRVDAGESSTFEKVFAQTEGWVTQKDKPFKEAGKSVRAWARFDLPPVAEARRLLLNNYAWEHVEYFIVRDGKLVDRQRVGILEPWGARKIQITMTDAIWNAGYAGVEQRPGSKVTIFARLETNSEFIAVRSVRFYGWDADRVFEGERRDLVAHAFFLGVVAVLLLYNLGVYVFTREPSYPFYAMHLAGGALIASMTLCSAYLWPGHPSWNFYAVFIGVTMAVVGHFQFARYFLDTRRNYRYVDRLLNGLTALFVVILLAILADFSISTNPVVGLAGPVPMFVVLFVAIYAVYRRHPLGGYFLAGTACLTVGVFASEFARMGWYSPSDLTEQAGQIGTVFEGIFLSMGLGYRLQRMQAAHEREKLALVEEQNRSLEGKVRERTAELRATQEKSDALLANILPEAIISELKANGSSEPRRHEEVSVLFTDFAGFTQAVATMPAKRLVQELDEIFRAFDDIVREHGLEKIKTIGDAYMAAAGLPVAAEDHALRCVRAGLALVRFIETRNRASAVKWGLRVGVHSGAAVAGIVGKNKYAYDVWGDTVNIASRIESAGESNRVNVSAYTFELIRGHFECEYRGKLEAKGKGAIDMYFVLRERTAPEHASTTGELAAGA